MSSTSLPIALITTPSWYRMASTSLPPSYHQKHISTTATSTTYQKKPPTISSIPCHHHYSHHNHCYWYHRPPPTANHRPRPSSKINWSDRPAGVPPGIFPQEFNLGFYSLSPQAYTYIYSDVHQCVHNVMKDVPYWIVYSEHLSDTNRWDILPVTVIVSSTPLMDESISWNNTV